MAVALLVAHAFMYVGVALIHVAPPFALDFLDLKCLCMQALDGILYTRFKIGLVEINPLNINH